MSVAGVNATTTAYAAAYKSVTDKTENKAAEEKKETEQSTGAVYDKSSTNSGKATYSINKMTSEQRDALVKQMKEDLAARQSQLFDIVSKTIHEQAGSADFWAKIAKGGLTVSDQAKAQAQEAISEDGYFGVKKTSQRIFDFASALAGDDEEKMKEMEAAFEKGFKQATKAWGRDLPGISNQTYDAVKDLFNDYYDSKKVITED